jgi:hypothetical protein
MDAIHLPQPFSWLNQEIWERGNFSRDITLGEVLRNAQTSLV